MRRLKRATRSIILGAYVISAGPGCFFFPADGAIWVTGTAYEWLNTTPEMKSRIIVDEPLSLDYQVSPLSGVNITLFHGADYAKEPVQEDTVWKNEAVTGSDGAFATGGTTNPADFHAAIRAEKAGYRPVTEVFLHDPVKHQIHILMVLESH